MGFRPDGLIWHAGVSLFSIRCKQFIRDPRAGYSQSLSTLEHAKVAKPGLYTKTSIMLGLGETDAEVIQTMKVRSFPT